MKPEIRTISTGSFEMDYAVFGTGSTPMVILPGMSLHPVTQSAGSVAAAYRCFAEECTVYLFDRKRNMQKGYEIIDMAEDTALAMEILGIRKSLLYGASQGGMMAMAIAVNHPELVGKLALASTSARKTECGHATMRRWAALADTGDPAALNRDIFRNVYSKAFYEKYKRAFERIENNGTPEELRAFRASTDASINFDIYDRLVEIKCPVQLYGMENDSVLGGEGIKDIAIKLGCEACIYPGTGHALYDEDRDFPEKLKKFFLDSEDSEQ